MAEKQLAQIWYEEITSLSPYVLPSMTVKEFWKSVSTWKSYRQEYSSSLQAASQYYVCRCGLLLCAACFVGLSVCHSSEPCKNGWTDRDAVWVEVHVLWGAHWRNLANTTVPSMCGGDAACSQITLATCFELQRSPQTPQPFHGPFSGTTRLSRCQNRTSRLYGARED